MLTTALRYLGGYVLLRAEGGSPERFLNLCSYREIVLWDVKPAGNAYEMKMWVRDVKRLAPVLRKSGVRIRIQKRIGLPFFLHRYRKRKVFFAGLFLAPVLIGILSLLYGIFRLREIFIRRRKPFWNFWRRKGCIRECPYLRWTVRK